MGISKDPDDYRAGGPGPLAPESRLRAALSGALGAFCVGINGGNLLGLPAGVVLIGTAVLIVVVVGLAEAVDAGRRRNRGATMTEAPLGEASKRRAREDSNL